MNRPTTLGLVALSCFLLAAVPALAAKGGSGGGNGGGSATEAWVKAAPSPAVAGGARVDVEGCGYRVEPVQIRIHHSAGYTETYGAGVWNTGCFSGYFRTSEAGTYTIEVWQSGSKTTMKASTTLTVS